jgi:fructose transport system permease protein
LRSCWGSPRQRSVGFINGFLVAVVKLPPFIVTLGMWQIVLATNFLYSATRRSAPGHPEQAPILAVLWHDKIARGRRGGATFTYGVIFMLLLVRSSPTCSSQTAWGRHVYAVGDDPEAAELSGVHVKRTLISVYMLSGLDLCLRRMGPDRPYRLGFADLGQMGNIESITAVVIGGISLFGGRGSIMGMFFGALIVGVFSLGTEPARRRRAMDLPSHRPAHHRRSRRRPVDQKGEHVTWNPFSRDGTSSNAMAA